MKIKKEMLKVYFTEEEIKEFSKKLAYQSKQLEELEDAKKSVVADFNSQIQSAKAEISKLANFINNGYEYKPVECKIIFNEPQVGIKTIIRTDTNEKVRTEPMTEDEMQGDLFEESEK